MRLLDLQLIDIAKKNKSKYLIKRLGIKQPLLYFFTLSLLSASSTVFAIKINDFIVKNSDTCKSIKKANSVQSGSLEPSQNKEINTETNIHPYTCHMILNYNHTATIFVLTFLYMFILYIVFYAGMALYSD